MVVEQATLEEVEDANRKAIEARREAKEAADRANDAESLARTLAIRANIAGPRHNKVIGGSACVGSLLRTGSTFHSDCDWEVYRCQRCGTKVLTPYIGHHWAYEAEATT